MQLSICFSLGLAVVLSPISPSVMAMEAGSEVEATGLVRDTLEASMLELAERGAFAEPGVAPTTIESPAELRYDLGAVLDPSGGSSAGVNILAVLPGSAAQAMGLAAGDQLILFNGVDLQNGLPAPATLREAMSETDGALELVVVRGESKLAFSGQARPVLVPAYTVNIAAPPKGCGRVTSFPGMARSQELFPITVRRIDGVEVINGQVKSHRLDGGRHRLMLAERIPPVELNSVEVRQRSLLQQRRLAKFKDFDLDVVPGFTYYLAARLFDPPRDVLNNQHWEPVVWQIKKERCR